MLQELAPCACGMRCGGRCGGVAGSAFSLLFPVAGGGQFGYGEVDGASPYGGGGGPVDCTLSLGTPSTRRAEAGVHARAAGGGRQDCGAAAAASCNNKESGRGSLRRCANCDTASTPLWRNGPRGPKSLCNACGIRYKKEERRAAAAVAPAPSPQVDAGLGSYACGAYVRQHHQQQHQPHQWGCYSPAAAAKSASFSMYGGGVDAAAADGSCLSWMLNVMPSSSPAFAVRERATLFQYY